MMGKDPDVLAFDPGLKELYLVSESGFYFPAKTGTGLSTNCSVSPDLGLVSPLLRAFCHASVC